MSGSQFTWQQIPMAPLDVPTYRIKNVRAQSTPIQSQPLYVISHESRKKYLNYKRAEWSVLSRPLTVIVFLLWGTRSTVGVPDAYWPVNTIVGLLVMFARLCLLFIVPNTNEVNTALSTST